MPAVLSRLLMAATLTACLPAAAASLVQNGNFSEPRPYDPTRPASVYNPWVPQHWVVAPYSADEPLGDDLAQNFAVVESPVTYGVIAGASGLLLAMYNVAHVEQTFTVTEGGQYRIAWADAAPRAGYGGAFDPYLSWDPQARGLRYAVTLDGVALAQRRTTVGQGFARHGLTLALDPGTYTLGFTGLDHGRVIHFGSANQYTAQSVTHIALFDNVGVSMVPEPSTYALLLGGLGVVGWYGARRKRRPAAPAA